MEKETITTATEEMESMVPDGWHDAGDFFDESTWEGDEPASEEENDAAEGEDSAPTTEQETTPGDTGTEEEEAPTTEPEAETGPHKLKFRARVDRQDLDVELDESELPTIYQKAQVTDRAQARLAGQTARLDKAEQIAKSLGFEGLEGMMESAAKKYRDGEVERLVGEGVHEEVARDMVERRMSGAEGEQSSESTQEERKKDTTRRDFKAEAQELLASRPEMRGKSIPEEVVRECVNNGKSLVAAYAEYEVRQAKADAEKYRKENEILRQNAASAKKAPVSGTKGGGSTGVQGEDDFLRGFNDGY